MAKTKKKITIALSGFVKDGHDGSVNVVLVSNDVWHQLNIDDIDRRLDNDTFDIELTIDEDGNILEGLDIATEEDAEEFNQEIIDFGL